MSEGTGDGYDGTGMDPETQDMVRRMWLSSSDPEIAYTRDADGKLQITGKFLVQEHRDRAIECVNMCAGVKGEKGASVRKLLLAIDAYDGYMTNEQYEKACEMLEAARAKFTLLEGE